MILLFLFEGEQKGFYYFFLIYYFSDADGMHHPPELTARQR